MTEQHMAGARVEFDAEVDRALEPLSLPHLLAQWKFAET